MNSPPTDAANVIAAALGTALSQVSQSSSPSPQDAPSSISPVSLSKAVNVTRIETDDFEKCHAKIVRQRKYLISEKITIVHLKDDDGTFSITPL